MDLMTKAAEAMKNAYAPYSKFTVGSAVLGGSGQVYTGCNVENASYGATICAERTAISSAIAHGEKKITKIALINGSPKPVTPCGVCLQVIAEFAGPETEIEMADVTRKQVKTLKLKELLPHAFEKSSLKI